MAKDTKTTRFNNILRRPTWVSFKDSKSSRRDAVFDDPTSLCTVSVAEDRAKLTFFDLPAEIRNAIYDIIASQTVLTLPRVQKPAHNKKDPPPICGLLLASRQCRLEFLPLFLSTAKVVISIKDFDFRNLMRVVGSLYSTELKALRQNNSLVIHLWTNNCAREHLLILRRWLNQRADAMDRLPWQYEVPLLPTMTVMGQIRQLRELEYYKRKLEELRTRLDENLQWELQNITEAFEAKAVGLEADLKFVNVPSAADVRRNLRGLSGGGVI